jgi:Transposase protein
LKQFELLYCVQKRYSPQCLLSAFRINCASRPIYCYLRENCLTLPHPSYLRSLSSCFTLNNEESHFIYLQQKCNVLNESERSVVLLLDEIYVKPKVTYKGGSLQGFAENADSAQATTVLAYMISSVMSKNKDVAALQPIINLDVSYLYDRIMKVLHLTEKAGYKVLAVMSDNNRVNRNVFEKMCGGTLQPSICHPCDPLRRLFLFV